MLDMRDVTQSAHRSVIEKRAIGGGLFLAGVTGVLLAAPAHHMPGLVAAGVVELVGLGIWLGTLTSSAPDQEAHEAPTRVPPPRWREDLLSAA